LLKVVPRPSPTRKERGASGTKKRRGNEKGGPSKKSPRLKALRNSKLGGRAFQARAGRNNPTQCAPEGKGRKKKGNGAVVGPLGTCPGRARGEEPQKRRRSTRKKKGKREDGTGPGQESVESTNEQKNGVLQSNPATGEKKRKKGKTLRPTARGSLMTSLGGRKRPAVSKFLKKKKKNASGSGKGRKGRAAKG